MIPAAALRVDMAARSVSWPVPYLSKLESTGLQPGQTVIINGIVTGPERFTVNLTTGPRVEGDTRDNIALHLSVRMDEKEIVMNALNGNAWGKEVRKKNPFKEGDNFDLRIRAHDSKFEIMANQKDLAEFDHRLPLGTVTHLYISGQVQLNGVHWGGKYYPVPFETGVEGGLTPGKRVYISGVPDKSAKRFHVNLVNQNRDIPFHFSCRFDEKVVVRNNYENGAWQKEEREGKLPFEKDKAFDLIIANETYAFQVYVNGQLFCAFAHRGDPNSIKGLQIEGDVELQGVHVN